MTEGERFGRLEVRMDRVEKGVSNFVDFQKEARDFFSEHRATEAEREKQLNKRDQEIKDSLADHYEGQDRKQKNRQFWLMWVLALLGSILAILTYLEGNRQVKGGELSWPKITASSPTQAQAHNRQHAGEYPGVPENKVNQ